MEQILAIPGHLVSSRQAAAKVIDFESYLSASSDETVSSKCKPPEYDLPGTCKVCVKKFFCFLLFISLILGNTNPLMAQWTHITGPYNGPVTVLTADSGGDIFAAAGSAVYWSRDNGTSWAIASGSINPTSLLYNPNTSALLAGRFNGIDILKENGTNWTLSPNVVLGKSVNSMSISPDNKMIAAGTDNGLFYSIDNGLTWNPVGSADHRIESLGFSPDGKNLYAGTSFSGFFHYTKNGTGWVKVDSSLGNILGLTAMAVAADGTLYINGYGIVRVSTDNGADWTQTGPNLGKINTLAVSPDGKTVFAGTIVYGSSGGGVFVTSDSGKVWTPSNSGLTVKDVNSLLISPDGSTILAGTAGGVFRSTDNGADWSRFDQGLTVSSSVKSLIVSPGGPTLLAGTSSGLYYSTDNGTTWLQPDTGQTIGSSILSLIITRNDTIFAGTDGQGIFRSGDNGKNWTPVNNGFSGIHLNNEMTINTFACDSTGDIFAGTGYGVFRSTNNGATWNSISKGTSGPYNGIVNTLAVSSNGGVVYAGGIDVYITTDDGKSWTEPNYNTSNYFGNVGSLALSSDGTVYALDGGNIYESTNQGKDWTPIDSSLTYTVPGIPGLYKPYTYSISITPDGSRLFAATDHGTYLLALPVGKNWTEADTTGLTNPDTYSFTFSPDGNTLYAVTGNGIYTHMISELTAVETASSALPAGFRLNQNYPNPFNPATTISYSLPESENVKIEVFNVLGEKAATLVNGFEQAGSHKVQWNAGSFASGIYLYRLNAGSFVKTKKMILLK